MRVMHVLRLQDPPMHYTWTRVRGANALLAGASLAKPHYPTDAAVG